MDDTTQPSVPIEDQSTLLAPPDIPVEELTNPIYTKDSYEPTRLTNTANTPETETIVERTHKTKTPDGKLEVEHTTIRVEEYETPFNTSKTSTVTSVRSKNYTEDQTFGLIPKFTVCTRKRSKSVVVEDPCEYCEARTDHGGCEAKDTVGGCPLNCCRRHLTDSNYTRDETAEFSDVDSDSIYEAMDHDSEAIYQSTLSLADREEDELDRFEKSKTMEELAFIYGSEGISSDEEEHQAGPSNKESNVPRDEDVEERYISGQQYKQHTNMDVSDDMSPNATSTGDEKDLGRNTPGVSDDVHKLSLVEEATSEQQMEVTVEESEGTEGEREKEKVKKKKKRSQPSKRKKK